MGISRQVLTLYTKLFNNGLFSGLESVIELGSQDLHLSVEDLEVFFGSLNLDEKSYQMAKDRLSELDRKLICKDIDISPDFLYQILGFSEYACIDTDGMHNAFQWDLNIDIFQEKLCNRKYDFVTNFGTTEHVFDVATCFKNIHNLCNNGGLIINSVPFQGHVDHGFYNFQPQFFEMLAAANGYLILEKYLIPDSEVPAMVPYSRELVDYIANNPYRSKHQTAVGLCYIFRKINDESFKAPFGVGDLYRVANTAVRDYYSTAQYPPERRAVQYRGWIKLALKVIEKLRLLKLFRVG